MRGENPPARRPPFGEGLRRVVSCEKERGWGLTPTIGGGREALLSRKKCLPRPDVWGCEGTFERPTLWDFSPAQEKAPRRGEGENFVSAKMEKAPKCSPQGRIFCSKFSGVFRGSLLPKGAFLGVYANEGSFQKRPLSPPGYFFNRPPIWYQYTFFGN